MEVFLKRLLNVPNIRPPLPLSESERAQEQCILLPLFHELTENQDYTVATLTEALQRGH